MALVVGEWVFDAEAAPSLTNIAEGLQRSTGLEVIEEDAGKSATLSIPVIGENLFDWRIERDRITVHSFAPAHPYIWEHLDAVLSSLGGSISDVAYCWSPDAAHSTLRRPWAELNRHDRLVLRIPTIAASRPLDCLLRRTS